MRTIHRRSWVVVAVSMPCLLVLAAPARSYAQSAASSQPGYAPAQPAGRPTAQVVVYPDTTDWFAWTPNDSSVAITAANPRSGRGSLELTKAYGNGSAFINESRTFGTLGSLSSFALDWFVDSSSTSSLPPDVALRVYPYGDPRSFFLVWNGCSATACGTYPTGAWQRKDLVRSLSIQQAGSNPPPARLSDVPADAPIVGIHVRASYSFGTPWQGFVDNLTLGFTGQRPTNFNFEVPDPGLVLKTASVFLTNAHVDPAENSQVVRAFVPTGSKSPNCLATLNETNAFAFGIVLFCGEREPAGLGGTPGVVVSAFFPQPVPPGFVLSLTLYQQGAASYGAPVLCTAATGCQ
jgi:hypothetical protein